MKRRGRRDRQTAGVHIGEAGARLVDRFGPGVERWLDEVPALAARVASQWGIVLGELFASGASSVVMRCRWGDGRPAVLKLSPDRALLATPADERAPVPLLRLARRRKPLDLTDRRAAVATLFEAYVKAPFPSRWRGADVAGFDMVMLDAYPAGCVSVWLEQQGILDDWTG
jgi:hypothetical protein